MSVGLYLFAQLFPILKAQVHLLLKTLVFEKVDVFKCGCRFSSFCLYFSCDTWPLNIIYSENVVFRFEFERFAHQNQVYWSLTFHAYVVNSINARQQRFRILFKVFVELWQNLL